MQAAVQRALEEAEAKIQAQKKADEARVPPRNTLTLLRPAEVPRLRVSLIETNERVRESGQRRGGGARGPRRHERSPREGAAG